MWLDNLFYRWVKKSAAGTAEREAGQAQENPNVVQPNAPANEDNAPEKPEEGNNPEQLGAEKYTNDDPKEPTRGMMATVFVLGFFIVIIMCFVYAGWINAAMNELKDMIVAVIGALSGLIGFVIGYYFKTKD